MPRLTWPPRSGLEKPILGLFRPGQRRRRHNMAWNISASDLSAYWRAISFRSVVRRAMFRARTYVARRPHLDAFTKQIIARITFLDRWVRAAVRAECEDRFQAIPVRARRLSVADLTPRACRVYLDLMRALNHGRRAAGP